MMNIKEKRKYERIPNNDLPSTFKNLSVDVGEHKHLNADTMDVSTNGIGVFLSLPNEILSKIDQVVLYSSDNRCKFSGKVVHFFKLKEDYYRMGIELKNP